MANRAAMAARLPDGLDTVVFAKWMNLKSRS